MSTAASAGMQAALLIREKQRLRRKKFRRGRSELPTHVATKDIAPFPPYPPGSWRKNTNNNVQNDDSDGDSYITISSESSSSTSNDPGLVKQDIKKSRYGRLLKRTSRYAVRNINK
ncbi:hypothetical protein QE152_g7565 [Popillia japonica]|uniref:Uncharacterized protein n=1 Tax=Popillia japonica TaxID=7064 RepID=A0AAW1MD78_POPJA